MFDDSMIDFMLRMQGRKVSVKMDKTVAEIGLGKAKTVQISKAKSARLESFRRNVRPRLDREDSHMRYDFISFRDFDTAPRENVESFIVISTYPTDVGRAGFEDAWFDGRRVPHDFLDADVRPEIGQWMGVRNLAQGDIRVIRENLADRIRRGTVRVLRLDDTVEAWSMISARSEEYANFLRDFLEAPPNIQLEHRAIVTSNQVALDLKLLYSHWAKAREVLWDTWENTLSWASWSFTADPSYDWVEWGEAMGETPPFKELVLAEHLYKRIKQNNPGGLSSYSWIPHPLTGAVPRSALDSYDGEWFTYDIPVSDVKKDDIDIVKDFNNFLLERLVRR